MNELVMYNNDLNTIILPESFTDAELRVFFAVVSRLRDKGTSEVRFSYSYLREITKEKKHYTKQQYSELIQGIYHKLIGLRFAYMTDDVVGEVNLFQSYEKSLSDESFTISVSPKFQYMFNELAVKGSFTAWNLTEFCSLPGVYPKQLYRLLKQWKYVGSASFKISDIRQYMGVPEKYATKDFTRRVIVPSISKLIMNTSEFRNLSYEYSNINGKAYRIKFTWTPEARKKTNSIENKKADNYHDSDKSSIDELIRNAQEMYQLTEETTKPQRDEEYTKKLSEGSSKIDRLIKETQDKLISSGTNEEVTIDLSGDECGSNHTWTFSDFFANANENDKRKDDDDIDLSELPL